MKVTLLKDFDPHKKGDTVEIEDGIGEYWQSVGVAEKAEKKTTSAETNKKPAVKTAATKAPVKKASKSTSKK